MPTVPVFYAVWDELNCDEDEAIAQDHVYAAIDIASAAMLHAKYRFGPDEGSARSWPVPYLVRNLSTKKLYRVSVALDWDPVFTPGKPEEI